ncbi:MAG: hypothetical protein K2X53_06085 [Alphaproteobacteria bacterium]|nr:hypothetical protein [Alphaproteobacteria bacterium]
MKKFLTSSLVALAIAGTSVPADAFSFSSFLSSAHKAVSTVVKKVGPAVSKVQTALKDPKNQAILKAVGTAVVAGGTAAYAAHKAGGSITGALQAGVMAGGAAGMAAHAAGNHAAVEGEATAAE